MGKREGGRIREGQNKLENQNIKSYRKSGLICEYKMKKKNILISGIFLDHFYKFTSFPGKQLVLIYLPTFYWFWWKITWLHFKNSKLTKFEQLISKTKVNKENRE